MDIIGNLLNSKHYGGKPALEEGDIFKAYIPLNKAEINRTPSGGRGYYHFDRLKGCV